MSRFKSKIIKITILASSCLTVMAGATIAPSLPQMKIHFAGIENADILVKLILTVPALAIAVSAPFAGLIIDNFGRKPLLLLSLILYGLAGTSGYFASSIFFILAGRAFLGVAVAGIMTVSTTLIADYFKGTRFNKFMGLQAGFLAFGGVLFLLFGGLMADISWRAPFLIYLCSFVIFPFALYFIYEPKITERGKNSRGLKLPGKTLSLISLLYLLMFIHMLIFYLIPVHLPFYLRDIQIESNFKAGFALGCMAFMAGMVGVNYKFIREHLDFYSIFLLVYAAMAAGFIIMCFSSSYFQVIIGLIIYGIGLGGMTPNINVYLLTGLPEIFRGRILGGLSTFLFLGQFLAPVFSEPFIGDLGIKGVYAAAAVILVFHFLIFIIVVIFKRRNQSLLVKSLNTVI